MYKKEIHNIFSNKESVESGPVVVAKKPKIIVDYREKNSFVPALLVRRGFEVEFKELKVADYLINDVAIERKEVRDFVVSIINRRIVRQLVELSQYEKKILFIEGIYEQELYNDENVSGMSANAIRGFLLSVALRYNVPIIFTKNAEDTSRFMWVLANKKGGELNFNVKKKARNKKEQLELILEGFPGIGCKTARKLLEKFGSLKNIFGASEEELYEVIGKKAEVFSLLGGKY